MLTRCSLVYFGALLVIVIWSLMRYRYRIWLAHTVETAERPEVTVGERSVLANRFALGLISIIELTIDPVIVNSFATTNCGSAGTKTVLLVDTSIVRSVVLRYHCCLIQFVAYVCVQECFSTDHLPVFSAAVFLLFVYYSLPVVQAIAIRRRYPLKEDNSFFGHLGLLSFDEFKRETPYAQIFFVIMVLRCFFSLQIVFLMRCYVASSIWVSAQSTCSWTIKSAFTSRQLSSQS